MTISPVDQDFVDKRERIVRIGPAVLAALLLVVLAFASWLFTARPLLANPFEVMSLLEQDAIEQPTLILMAAMLPVMMLACLGLLAVILVFAHFGLLNERRYLRLLGRLI